MCGRLTVRVIAIVMGMANRMQINQEKIKEIIEAELKDMERGPYCQSAVCIGVVGDLQIQIVVTRDDDQLIDEPLDKWLCITT